MNKVPVEVSVHWRYLHQDLGKTWKEIATDRKRGYHLFSKATICRHMKREINEKTFDKRKNNKGRPKKLSSRDQRLLMRQVEVLRARNVNFTAKRLKLSAGLTTAVSDQTVRRVLHKNKLRYRHAAKKGVLSREDLKKRMDFAKKVIKYFSNGDIWTEGIGFYLDGASFTHKYNPCDQAMAPKTMIWRRPNERLKFGLTAKGNHEGNGGKQAHFMVAISYNRGVVLCEQYMGRLNGEFFADFIRSEFPAVFENCVNPKGKLFLQDGDPSQNSGKAKDAMYDIGARKFTIPARSPDFNPIENIFNLVKRKLSEDALQNNIVQENFNDFSDRVKKTIISTPIEIIDKTISSMKKRAPLVLKSKGQRLRY